MSSISVRYSYTTSIVPRGGIERVLEGVRGYVR